RRSRRARPRPAPGPPRRGPAGRAGARRRAPAAENSIVILAAVLRGRRLTAPQAAAISPLDPSTPRPLDPSTPRQERNRTMEYRTLGTSGLRVSTLCLGTMTFGQADENSFMHKVGCDEPTSFEIMGRALDAGVNFFDTADVYGQDGLTERVIGKWFAEAGRRDEVVLATKFRFQMGKGANRS